MNLLESFLNAAGKATGAESALRNLRFAGQIFGKIAPTNPLVSKGSIAVDAAQNAYSALTGRREQINPSSYLPATRRALGQAITRAESDPKAPRNKAGFTAVNYKDYSPSANPLDSLCRLVTGRMWAKSTPDGFEISPSERYDFNASTGTDAGVALGVAKSALDRGDLAGAAASVPDFLAGTTGIGKQGYGIGGQFDAGFKPSPAPVASVVAPPRKVTVRSGDTLTDIARATGTTVEQLVSKNRIADPNLISAGQSLTF